MVCNKEQAGYTVKSGVLKPFSLAQIALAGNNQTIPFIASDIVRVIPCEISNDGNAIKPSIKFTPRLKRCIGLNIDVDAANSDKVTSRIFQQAYCYGRPYFISNNTL